jgi:hypothetical protein
MHTRIDYHREPVSLGHTRDVPFVKQAAIDRSFGGRVQEPLFCKKKGFPENAGFLPAPLLDKVERDGDKGQQEQNNGRPAQESAAAVQRRIGVQGRGVS